MNAAQLGSTLSDSLKGTRLIVVANREPYIHIRRKRTARGVLNWLRGRTETEGIAWTRPASGLVTALDPVLRATGGTRTRPCASDASTSALPLPCATQVPPHARITGSSAVTSPLAGCFQSIRTFSP